jgi:hypothetical protein
MTNKNRVVEFYSSNKDKFKTKRQASKYLNKYGSVYKAEQGIPLEAPKRRIK